MDKCDKFLSEKFEADSDKVQYTVEHNFSKYEYSTASVEHKNWETVETL